MRIHAAALRALVTLVSLSTSVLSQPHGTLTETSYARARAVLERGIQAHGGLKAFQAVESIHFKSSAKVPEDGQSASPEAPLYIRPLDSEGVMDLAHKRYYLLRLTNYIGSGPRGSSIVTTDNAGFTADLRSNAVYPFASAAIAANNRSVQRAFPYLLLQLALNRAATLRWLGEEEYGGRKQDVVSFIDGDGTQLTLCLDAETGLLTKTEGLSDSLLKGLGASETVFSDYRAVDGVAMPFHVVTRLAGETTSDAAYSQITFNTHPDASIFERPKDAVIGPEVGGPRQPITLRELAKDVYYVSAIETGSIFFYSSLFVAFKDYVLVIESPLNDNVSQAIIAKIKETVPGKPIRYLVPTHYHVDHTAGVRGYIAEGSTVVTTPGNRKFVETLGAIAHPLNPDRLSREPRPVSVETFTRKRVFTDGEHVVELYDVGPTPHVDEMVIAYFPREKLAFVSDLFLVSYSGRNGPAEPSTVLFNDKIRELGLQVETIAGGHGRIGTMDELRQSLGERPAPSTEASAPSQPQPGRAPELVSFRNGDVTLAGSLYIPAAPGRHPAIVVLHAANGPARDYHAYRRLSTALPAAGVAVLLFDRRGTGASTGDAQTASFADLARDGLAGVSFLRSRPEIDPTHVGIAGISQGGWLAPLAASMSHDVAFVVSISGPGVSPARQMDYAAEYTLRTAGRSRSDIEKALGVRAMVNEYYRGRVSQSEAARSIASIRNEPWFGQVYLPLGGGELPANPGDSPWYREMDYDPLAVLEKVHIPIVFFFAEQDRWVPVNESIAKVKLATRRNASAVIRRVPGTDHVMETGAPDSNGPTSEAFVTQCLDWILKVTR